MRIAFLGNWGPSWSTENHLGESFEALGHSVTRIQEGEVRAVDVPARVVGHDLFAWVQTYGLAVTGGTIEQRAGMIVEIRGLGVPSIGLHLDRWWGLDRQDQIATEPFFRLDRLFTADGGHDPEWADAGVAHRWMPPGVLEREARRLGTPRREYACQVAFVGSWHGAYHAESKHRHELIRWLRSRRGVRFWPRRAAVRGQDLADLYASARIVVGDSCRLEGDRGFYCSDRIPETVGRGGFLIHPDTPGVTDGTLYEAGVHLETFPPFDFDTLGAKLDRYLEDEPTRARIAEQGRQHVLDAHTYTVRMAQVLALLEAEGVLTASVSA